MDTSLFFASDSKLENPNRELKVLYSLSFSFRSRADSKLENPNRELKDYPELTNLNVSVAPIQN